MQFFSRKILLTRLIRLSFFAFQ